MSFSPIETKKITENIYAIKDNMVNAYIYRDKENIIGIDCGVDKDIIACQLKSLNINPNSISHVFLTHSHHNSAEAMQLFNNAVVYMSVNEDMISYHDKNINRSCVLLKDGESINIGSISVKAISTPGHTVGSMCYLVNEAYLFTGDTLSIHHGIVRPFFSLPNMNTQMQKQSLKKLAKLKHISMLFTTHTGYTEDFPDAIKSWKRKN
ncbi:MAG: MBL fold metallo-hydrolase [Bacillota bacterium]|nr:MBL fold metallo-hydrolase [Bacillota bacterium]